MTVESTKRVSSWRGRVLDVCRWGGSLLTLRHAPKGGAKPVFYETWPLQLPVYRDAIRANGEKNVNALVSVVIDSAQPGSVHVRRWAPSGTAPEYFESFVAALELWKHVKDYDPASTHVAGLQTQLN